jgi:hypothetical protein
MRDLVILRYERAAAMHAALYIRVFGRTSVAAALVLGLLMLREAARPKTLGGWYRVRTCDPCRVKAVLYR